MTTTIMLSSDEYQALLSEQQRLAQQLMSLYLFLMLEITSFVLIHELLGRTAKTMKLVFCLLLDIVPFGFVDLI